MHPKRVLLVDVDSTIPNLALMKLSTYHKSIGDSVDFIKVGVSYYPTRKHEVNIDNSGYDKTYASTIFKDCYNYIKFSDSSSVVVGGTRYSITSDLPEEVKVCELDYSIYPDNDISYGFISRGCDRKCYFCVVPEKEGKIRTEDDWKDIVKHKKVKFLDNNFLQYPDHKRVLKELVEHKIKCQFIQGLDIRLIDEENSKLLSGLSYLGDFIFAFDDYKYRRHIQRKLALLDWRRDWQFKFYVYVHPDMELFETVKRIEWLRERKCLPYIMRDLACWDSERSEFYVDLAAYCNQPNIFKKMSFDEFLTKRHVTSKSKRKIPLHSSLYSEAMLVKDKLMIELINAS